MSDHVEPVSAAKIDVLLSATLEHSLRIVAGLLLRVSCNRTRLHARRGPSRVATVLRDLKKEHNVTVKTSDVLQIFGNILSFGGLDILSRRW